MGERVTWAHADITTFLRFCYVGSQVTIASFFLNYATENANFTQAGAAQMLSYGLITFTVARFIATGLAIYLRAISSSPSTPSAASESMRTSSRAMHWSRCLLGHYLLLRSSNVPSDLRAGHGNLGRHTRRGAGILVMGVSVSFSINRTDRLKKRS